MLFTTEEQRFVTAISHLAYGNPFLPERIEHESVALGGDYVASQPFWSFQLDLERKENIERLDERAAALAIKARDRLRAGRAANDREKQLYEDLVVYVLYERYREALLEQPPRSFYRDFRRDAIEFLDLPPFRSPLLDNLAHLFACFLHVRRAFLQIFTNIIGRTLPAARLRASVWQSIFTHDMRRYRRVLYSRMADVPTLITGGTGTGKEVVARAIALSRYVPFDERAEHFPAPSFVGLNLSALSPTLIESELFGHRKGAFTGAISDREGFLESCGMWGTVFLDEIGDVEPPIQVKLLRVIQTRTFQRLGDTAPKTFPGKIIAATNRELQQEIARGRFRDDFYYRLCADTIRTPALAEQVRGNPEELQHLVRFISARVAGEGEVDDLAAEVLRAIEQSPGLDYAWPGNFRELEQCVRSVMVHGTYAPHSLQAANFPDRIAAGILHGNFTADDLLRNYCTLLYSRTPNYSEIGERLGLDRRTVKAKVDPRLLDDAGSPPA